jgi:hypothetical protein
MYLSVGQVYYEDHKRLVPGITEGYVMKVLTSISCTVLFDTTRWNSVLSRVQTGG